MQFSPAFVPDLIILVDSRLERAYAALNLAGRLET
jgi:hypothetical protein